MLRRLLVLAVVLCAGQIGSGLAAPVAARATGCPILQVHAPAGATGSTVAGVRLPGGAPRTLRTLPYRVDAIGYSDAQDLAYALGVRSAGKARVVTIDRYGRARDLGVVTTPGAAAIPAASAGAIDGSNWYLGTSGALYTVDVDPASPAYLRVQRVREMRPNRLAAVADFAVDPASGRLYGVTVSARGDVIAVSIDPASGRVRPEPGVQLPSTRSVGSVVLAPGRTLFASTRSGGQGRWYQVQASGGVRVAGTAPASAHTDAAGCLPPPPAGPRPPARMPPLVPRQPPMDPSPSGAEPPLRWARRDPIPPHSRSKRSRSKRSRHRPRRRTRRSGNGGGAWQC